MKKVTIFLFIILLPFSLLFTQTTWCGSDIIINANHQNSFACLADSPEVDKYFIPTVVQVIYESESGAENISDSEILSAISSINTALENSGSPIELILAKVDPNGKCTNGIVREFDPILSNPVWQGNHLDVIETYNWSQEDYLNIAIVKDIFSTGGTPEVILGYAIVPTNSIAASDGLLKNGETVTKKILINK
jgi:hypothetical protein